MLMFSLTANNRFLGLAVFLLGVIATPVANAQVAWTTDEAGAIRRAVAEDRLLILFFTQDEGRGEREEHNRTDRAREGVKTAFRNPAVGKLVGQLFVPVQADNKLNGPLKAKLGGRVRGNGVVIATPTLEVLDSLGPAEAGNVGKLRSSLEKCSEQWVKQIYERGPKESLTASDATQAKQKAALDWVRRQNYAAADVDILSLLGHDKLNENIRTYAYETLADLGTEKAIRGLVKEACDNHPKARDAIRKTDLSALKILVTYLKGDPSCEFLVAYSVIATKTNAAPRNDEWWKSAAPDDRNKEIELIRKRVEAKVK